MYVKLHSMRFKKYSIFAQKDEQTQIWSEEERGLNPYCKCVFLSSFARNWIFFNLIECNLTYIRFLGSST